MSKSVTPENMAENITHNIDKDSDYEVVEGPFIPVGNSKNCCDAIFNENLNEFMRGIMIKIGRKASMHLMKRRKQMSSLKVTETTNKITILSF